MRGERSEEERREPQKVNGNRPYEAVFILLYSFENLWSKTSQCNFGLKFIHQSLHLWGNTILHFHYLPISKRDII